MFSRILKPIASFVVQNSARSISISCPGNYKVAVIGACGGIGQGLCLLLKKNPLVTNLSLFDLSKITPGVAVDLSHINTASKVIGYTGKEQLRKSMKGADIVVIPAGVPRKPGMSRDDLFKSNASVVRDVIQEVCEACPEALIAIITNPVNATVPIAAEVLKKAGIFDKRRLFGVTTLDVVRSATFVANIHCLDPREVFIPVIGGHAGVTIIPVLSQSQPPVEFKDEAKALTHKIQEAGTEVVKAKAGAGSATLSMAFAAARFVNSLMLGLKGESDIVECAYVKSDETDAPFFATPLLLGTNGIETNLGIGNLNEFEQTLLRNAIPMLCKSAQQGVDFINNKKSVSCIV